jgi:hypothetical protein
MFTLGEIITSDYNLLGAMTEEELLGALEKAPQQERRQFLRRMKQQTQVAFSNKSDSRSEFEKRINQLPREIQQGLANKTLQAVDAAYYVTKNVSNNKIAKMLKDDDTKIVAVSNISGGKLEKGNIMLLSGLIMLASVGGAAKVEEAKFDLLTDVISNGEFEFKANGTTLVPITSCEVFNTFGTTRQMGYYKLDNPKIIYDQQAMEMNVEWGVNAPDNTFIKAMLVGTAVTKY